MFSTGSGFSAHSCDKTPVTFFFPLLFAPASRRLVGSRHGRCRRSEAARTSSSVPRGQRGGGCRRAAGLLRPPVAAAVASRGPKPCQRLPAALQQIVYPTNAAPMPRWLPRGWPAGRGRPSGAQDPARSDEPERSSGRRHPSRARRASAARPA